MRRFVERFRAMGSPCEVQLWTTDSARAHVAIAAARAEVERLEQKYSRFRDDSLLSRINRVAAAGGSCGVDAETAALLDYADACHRESDGRFDVTSGILRRAWRPGCAELPSPESVRALLDRIGWQRLRWHRPTLSFPMPGLELDFGGIVKEYAVDRVAGLLADAGTPNALVNLGGDLAVAGPHPDGSAWQIGIRHPHRRGALLGSIGLERGAMATSGDYERCIEVDGERFGHVLSPRTGWPVRGLASVSVIAARCVLAGSAATLAMLAEKRGPAWLAALGLPCLWVGVDGSMGGSLGQALRTPAAARGARSSAAGSRSGTGTPAAVRAGC